MFVANPEAPIAAVAERAGVGISALYRRYASKEDLLRRLCADGLARYIAAVEEALAATAIPGRLSPASCVARWTQTAPR